MENLAIRIEAIEILELNRHCDIRYTKGDIGNIRHFISHNEDPFTEEEIQEKINFIINLAELPKCDKPVKFNPQFDFTYIK